MTKYLAQGRSVRSGLLLAAPLTAVTLLTAACGGNGGSGGQTAAGGTSTGSQSSSMPAMSSSMPAMSSSSASSGESEGGAAMINGEKINNHGAKTVTGMGSVNMEMDDFYFEPSVLKGNPGQKITVHLENEGKVPHTFTLGSQQVDTVVQPGQEATVTVTFPPKTTLFVCRFHEQLGMRGALEVTTGGSGAATSPTS